MASWYYAGQDLGFPGTGVGIPFQLSARHKRVSGKDASSKSILFSSAVEGHVLVKNENGALPLRNPEIINVFGYDGKTSDTYIPDGTPLGWATGYSSWNQTQMIQFYTSNFTTPVSSIAQFGTLVGPGGSAGIHPGYISSPIEALSQRAHQDDSSLWWDFSSSRPPVPAENDACLVFINAAGTEAADRPSIDDTYSNELVLHVASHCNNTVVVVHNAWTRLVDSFVDHPNVTAIVFAHLPGQDSGRALVSLLYGDENFSGKLPYTVARNEEDYGSLLNPDTTTNETAGAIVQSDFAEGVLLDYRMFDALNIIPRYEFGYGLSYTSFAYSNLRLQKTVRYGQRDYPAGAIKSGGAEDLWDTLASVELDVANIGNVNGQEVVQLYIMRPDGTKWLRGFDKIALQPGETKSLMLDLTRRDLSEWDVIKQQWRLLRGQIQILVAASSRDVRLRGDLSL